jgi:hypothetical protein
VEDILNEFEELESMTRSLPPDDLPNMAASPPNAAPFALGGMSGFLPLNEDAVSTRGQRLPGLIRNRSAASLYGLQRHTPVARLSDEEQTSGTGPLRLSSREAGDGRRMSVGAEVLLTPQMRSMRLIGNSNPRYRW